MVHGFVAGEVCGEHEFWPLEAESCAAVNLVHHGLHLVVVGESVGHIEIIEIDAGVHKHLHVFGNDVAVAALVVAEGWLATPVELAHTSPSRIVGVGGKKLGDVFGLVAVLSVPHVIEHAYGALARECQAVVGGLDSAAKLVVAHPGVGKRVVGHIDDVFVVVAGDLR